MADVFGAKIKLSVDQSGKAEFQKQIDDFTKSRSIKINKIQLTPEAGASLNESLERLSKNAKLSIPNLKVDNFTIDTSKAVAKLRSDLTKMLSGLEVVGLKDFLGADALGKTYTNATSGAKAQLKTIASEVQSFAKQYQNALKSVDSVGGMDALGSDARAALEALGAATKDVQEDFKQLASVEESSLEAAKSAIQDKINLNQKYINSINESISSLSKQSSVERTQLASRAAAIKSSYSAIEREQTGPLNVDIIGGGASQALQGLRNDYALLNAAIKEVSKSHGEELTSAVSAANQIISSIEQEITTINEAKSAYREKEAASKMAGKASEKEASEAAAASARNATAIKQATELQKQLEKYKDANPKALKKYGAELDDLIIKINEAIQSNSVLKEDITTWRTGFSGLQLNIKQEGLEGMTMGDKIKDAYQRFGGWTIVTRSLMAAWRGVKDMVSAVKELDTVLASLKFVTEESWANIEKLGKSAAQAAKEIGSSITDILASTEVFARLGFNLEQSLDFAKLTSMFSKIGDVNVSDATDNITAIVKAYNIGADQLEAALDKIINVDVKSAISSADIGRQICRAA